MKIKSKNGKGIEVSPEADESIEIRFDNLIIKIQCELDWATIKAIDSESKEELGETHYNLNHKS